jgi:hypothetical protein
VIAELALAAAFAAPQTSPGVTVAGSIPEQGVISARAVGHHLYVSSLTGVSVFDVTNPRAPVRVGRLDLPNAQNEDVDVGSGILLVSDDPIGGRGVLHVVDVRDPTRPRVVSRVRSWLPGDRGIGHTATCIQRCRYAWLAGSPRGIDVIDLRDPEHPRRAGRFRARAAAGSFGTHDVQVDRAGLAWVAGSNGTAAYDVSNPSRPRLVRRTDRRGAGPPLNDLIHHNSLRLRRNVVAITEEAFANGCRGAGTLQTWRFTRRGRMAPLDSWGVERDPSARVLCSAHYFDARAGLIAQGFYEQGVRLIDARRPGRLRQVGYYVARPGLFWGALFAPTDPTGSTVYALDHSRGIDVLALDRAALRPVRRSGSPPSGPVNQGWGLFLGDDLDRLRPGQRVAIGFGLFGPDRRVDVRITLPRRLVAVRPPRGAAFDPATRTVSLRLRGGGARYIRARVDSGARVGTQLETIGYVSGPGDPMPLDDRAVDRGVVARRTARASVATAARVRQGFCSLASDYPL